MPALLLDEATTTLRVEALLDPVIDQLGHDPRSTYVELFWLPVLGPSATWLLRRLARQLDERPGGVDLDAAELARALGLGERAGRHAPFARTVQRCVDFDMARWEGESRLAVRRRLPPLARRHLARLTEARRAEHEAYLASRPDTPPAQRLARHGRELALSLLAIGEEPAAVEQQLHRWAFHPALAHDCVAWALAESERRRSPDPLPPARDGGPEGASAAVPAAPAAVAPPHMLRR
jgi:hypothetical protein